MRNPPPVNDHRGPDGAERRREPRRRVLLQGKIVYPHNSFSADCVIRDLSAGGARITLPPEAVSQDPFLIVVRQAVVHESTTVWSTPSFTGLKFDRSHSLGGETPLQLRHIQRLWTELAPR